MARQEALLPAGPVRLRPILMTAFSTVAGVIPVAMGLGSGAETRSPMGIAIVGGMLTPTVLTLIVVPIVYSLLDDLAGWLRKVFVRRPSQAVSPVAAAISPESQTTAEETASAG